MNDTEIRKILIAYLQTEHEGCRIFEEKNIGRSVCDVMMVINEIAGYEIKGDNDDRRRLETQVAGYEDFFDRCFIVVGETHENTIDESVPPNWGIIVIHKETLTVKRHADINKAYHRNGQLQILWRLELKNILMRNNLPLFSEKDESFIRGYLTNSLSDEVLRQQICQELKERDYGPAFLNNHNIANAPQSRVFVEALDALSERSDNLTLDQWIDLYRQASEIKDRKREQFENSSSERPPHAITYENIEPTLGAPWISARIIEDFVTHLLEDEGSPNVVSYEPITGNWRIHQRGWRFENIRSEQTYGLPQYNVGRILDCLLNAREICVNKYESHIDERATIRAIEKGKLITKEFKDWVWKDPDRIWEIEEAYNATFGAFGKVTYDGSRLDFQEMSGDYELYPYQKDAIQKILESSNTLLAFDVGAGKTFIMIAAAMKLRQCGASRRNMFVVPNNIVGQWEKMFLDLYPHAKILAIEPRDFTPKKRAKVLGLIRDGDFDGIIIAYSCFEQIRLSKSAILENATSQLKRIEQALAAIRFDQSSNRYALEKEKKYIEKLANGLIASIHSSPANDITFDDLTIETLFVDEAHNYKNLPIKTHLKNLNGINVKGSSKCLELLQKVRHVQTYGRGAVLATGTPLCNSISDAYVFQVYLQNDELERTHLNVFDNWVKTFAVPEQAFEIDVNVSSYRMVTRFARFHNLSELIAMFSQIAVFFANTSRTDLPEVEEAHDTIIKPSPEFESYMKSIVERTEAIRSKKMDPRRDNMLKVSTDGRKAALDLRLVNAEQAGGDYSKIESCATNVASLYFELPGRTQIVFCDHSTPGSKVGEDGFNVYGELKELLIERGIPSSEIAFIHSYKTEASKRKLFERFNKGEVRILMGSTFKLGIGANVQRRLKAVHHLDVPWRPADMVQREGRMIRSGNENDEVRIYRYIMKGSFDSYSWQLLERKQRFISQFLSGSPYQKAEADLAQNVLSYAEVKALALNNPLMMQIAEKENELSNLKVLSLESEQATKEMQEEVQRLKDRVPALKKRIGITKGNLSFVESLSDAAFKELCSALAEQASGDFDASRKDTSELTEGISFELEFPKREEAEGAKPFVYITRFCEKYKVEIGDSLQGNRTRFSNFFKKLEITIDEMNQELADAEERIEALEGYMANQRDEYTTKIQECEEEIEALRSMARTMKER